MIVDRVKHIFKLAQVRCRDFTKGLTIAGFHMASQKFKVKNFKSYCIFIFMKYYSSWKLIFIHIFTAKETFIEYALITKPLCERAIM